MSMLAEKDLRSSASVLATEEGLRRVLDNLIDNAVRFSPAGGEVRCLVADLRSTVRFAVEDDGPGIPRKELANVFDRFYQASGERASRPRARGTGLGLSIVLGLVQEMNGTVRAISHEGRYGTRMVVDLPILVEPKGGEHERGKRAERMSAARERSA